ncbi:hypothetical protein CLOP_g13555 [Closterium sp. NIES-67]|nr:hypothetical protein CLOP_g13555 [Closterium sp. NIES-67]
MIGANGDRQQAVGCADGIRVRRCYLFPRLGLPKHLLSHLLPHLLSHLLPHLLPHLMPHLLPHLMPRLLPHLLPHLQRVLLQLLLICLSPLTTNRLHRMEWQSAPRAARQRNYPHLSCIRLSCIRPPCMHPPCIHTPCINPPGTLLTSGILALVV